MPLRHPHRVGGVLRHLHDADRERLISLVDMVSHYLAGGRETTRGASTQPALLRGHKACGFRSSWGNRVKAVEGSRRKGKRGDRRGKGGEGVSESRQRERGDRVEGTGGWRQGSEGKRGKEVTGRRQVEKRRQGRERSHRARPLSRRVHKVHEDLKKSTY